MGVLFLILLLGVIACIFFGVIGFVLKFLYIVAIGIPIGIVAACAGLILCLTVIGIPIGMLLFKLARFMLYPF